MTAQQEEQLRKKITKMLRNLTCFCFLELPEKENLRLRKNVAKEIVTLLQTKATPGSRTMWYRVFDQLSTDQQLGEEK